MSQAQVLIDSAASATLSTTAVIPVLNGAVTGTGSAVSAQTTLASLATFFGTNMTTAGAITVTGSDANPAGTVRYVASPDGGTTGLAFNVLTGGTYNFRIAGSAHLALSANSLTLGSAGAASSINGRAASGTDTASGSTTFNANVGTGSGAVGGYVFKVPITHGSDSVAQTLTEVLKLDATTSVRIGFYGVTPTTRQVLATGTGKTVDNVITALQTLGLVSQT